MSRAGALLGAFLLAGCAAPLYVCYPTSLAPREQSLEVLVCFPHARDELTLKSVQADADALRP